MNKIIGPFVIKEILGSGQFGKVHRGLHIESKSLIAIKIISMESFKKTPKLSEFLQNETKILSAISHRNIIKFHTMYHSSNNLYIIYEFCNGGNLDEHIKEKVRLEEHEAFYIFDQILEGFRELHKNNILHRDLKPSNILLHESLVKIADFGFCKEIFSSYELSNTMVGSPIYMAPEILKGQAYSSKADLWSLGTVLFEMLHGKPPFFENNIVSLINRLEKGTVNFPNDIKISASAKNLILQLLSVKEKDRISWETLLDTNKVSEFLINTECSTKDSTESANELTVKLKRKQLLVTSTILTLVLENSIKSLTIPVALFLVKSIKDLEIDCKRIIDDEDCNLSKEEFEEISEELEETRQMLDSFRQEIINTFGSPIFFENIPKLSSKVKLNISEYVEELIELHNHDKRSKWLVLAFSLLDCILVQSDFIDRLQNGREKYFKSIKKISKCVLKKEVMKKLEMLLDFV